MHIYGPGHIQARKIMLVIDLPSPKTPGYLNFGGLQSKNRLFSMMSEPPPPVPPPSSGLSPPPHLRLHLLYNPYTVPIQNSKYLYLLEKSP